jgi:predicted O-methyltransferase YrrM
MLNLLKLDSIRRSIMAPRRSLQFGAVSAVAARNMILGANLASIPLWRNPRRFAGYASEMLFFHKTLTDSRGLPQKNVFEVLGEGDAVCDIRLALAPDKEHWFHPVSSYAVDIISLCMLAQIVKPLVVFEIGTLRGYTALHFALNAPVDVRVYTLDLPRNGVQRPRLKTTYIDDHHIQSQERAYLFKGSAVEGKIQCLFGDSATFDFTPYDGKVDLFFIDGAHSYEYVRSDTLNALRCCHPGSVVAWHDFGRMGVNGVSKWLVEFSKDHQIYSVPGGSVAFMLVS